MSSSCQTLINELQQQARSCRSATASPQRLQHVRSIRNDHPACCLSPLNECRIRAFREWSAGSSLLGLGYSVSPPRIADPQQVRYSPEEVRCGRPWPCSRELRKLQEEKKKKIRCQRRGIKTSPSYTPWLRCITACAWVCVTKEDKLAEQSLSSSSVLQHWACPPSG